MVFWLTFNFELWVNCSRKHCHSRDRSQIQCHRSSMIFPTDWSTEHFLAGGFSLLLFNLLAYCASTVAHSSKMVLILSFCASISWCKFWKVKQKVEICFRSFMTNHWAQRYIWDCCHQSPVAQIAHQAKVTFSGEISFIHFRTQSCDYKCDSYKQHLREQD